MVKKVARDPMIDPVMRHRAPTVMVRDQASQTSIHKSVPEGILNLSWASSGMLKRVRFEFNKVELLKFH